MSGEPSRGKTTRDDFKAKTGIPEIWRWSDGELKKRQRVKRFQRRVVDVKAGGMQQWLVLRRRGLRDLSIAENRHCSLIHYTVYGIIPLDILIFWSMGISHQGVFFLVFQSRILRILTPHPGLLSQLASVDLKIDQYWYLSLRHSLSCPPD